MKKTFLVLMLLAAILLAGCGTTTQMVHISIPDAHVNPASGPTIAIASVVDSRIVDPKMAGSDPAVSVGGIVHGGSVLAVDSARPVTAIVHDAVANSLRTMGYQVVQPSQAPASEIAVTVDQFTAGFPFSFWRAVGWANHMVADVVTTVTVTDMHGKHTFMARGHGSNVFQIANSANWQLVIERALTNYETDFKTQMASQ